MKRELKFRGWNGRKMEYFDLYEILSYNEPSQEEECSYESRMNPAGLMQYTGLKDKNGKEIYEGDIVTCWIEDNDHPTGNPDVIEFRNGSFWLRYRYRTMSDWLLYLARDGDEVAGDFEIIGNIYETPELLQTSESDSGTV